MPAHEYCGESRYHSHGGNLGQTQAAGTIGTGDSQEHILPLAPQGQCHGLESHSGYRGRPWNRITPEEEGRILASAREFPELSSRQLAAWITDNAGFAVSESTVYRILLREGLVKRPEVQLVARK